MYYCAWAGHMEKTEFLARILQEHMGLFPVPSMLRLPLGKPYLAGNAGVNLSYSHSGDRLFAVTGKNPVGADIERIVPRKAGLGAYALSREEYHWYESRGAQWRDFYALWVMKEARVKCTGEGLTEGWRSIAVPLPQGGDMYRGGFTFRLYELGEYMAAACVRGRVRLPEQAEFLQEKG